MQKKKVGDALWAATIRAENGGVGGMHGRRGQLREYGGAVTGTDGMGEIARKSTAYETRRAM